MVLRLRFASDRNGGQHWRECTVVFHFFSKATRILYIYYERTGCGNSLLSVLQYLVDTIHPLTGALARILIMLNLNLHVEYSCPFHALQTCDNFLYSLVRLQNCCSLEGG